MGSQIKFFQPASDGEPSEWHAYREESAAALCGEATLSYNRDQVADDVPPNGALHLGCREAIDAENPAPYTPFAGDVTEETTEEQPITDGDVASLNDVLGAPAADGAADGGTETDATSDAGGDATDGVPAEDGTAPETSEQPSTEQPQ